MTPTDKYAATQTRECPKYSTGHHCTCWYDAEGTCCGCGEPQLTSARPHPDFDEENEHDPRFEGGKYAERAREILRQATGFPVEAMSQQVIQTVARALKQAEFGIQWAIDNHRSLRTHYKDERGNNDCGECVKLRARLAELRPEGQQK